MWAALLLLLVGSWAAYFWQAAQLLNADPDFVGQAWNVSTAVFRLLMLTLLWNAYRSNKNMQRVIWLLMTFDVIVASCSTAFILFPWPIIPGQSCTAPLQLPFGILGAVMALLLILDIVKGKR